MRWSSAEGGSHASSYVVTSGTAPQRAVSCPSPEVTVTSRLAVGQGGNDIGTVVLHASVVAGSTETVYRTRLLRPVMV